MNSESYRRDTADQANQFAHVVLTRFNVRTEFNLGAAPNHAWLEHRFQLFDQFAYPSMCNQVCKDFIWLIFLDKMTPRPFRERVQIYADNCPNMTPIYVESIEVGTPEMSEILRLLINPHISNQTTHLISTRFDNDDAVSENFISVIQEQFSNQEFEFINLPNGYLWRNDKLYTKRDQSNPFISLIETTTDFKTVWCTGHHMVDSYGPIRQVETTPHWIQVIHRRNVSNRVRVGNIRLPVKTLPSTFHLAKQFYSKQESEWRIDLENKMKKKIRRFRWKWKQFKKRNFAKNIVE